MNIDFPFKIAGDGRTSLADDDKHIRDLIELVIFTAPGERVNRPTFGTGLMQLVFAGNSPELAQATEYLLRSALQQYLGDRIDIKDLNATAEDSTLRVTVVYNLKQTQERRVATFVQ
jgi:phage baseplate assembly protein W